MPEPTPDATLGDRSEAEVRAAIRDVVRELSPDATVAPTPDSGLVEDLGYHSLALLELAFSLEDEFDLSPIDEPTARRIITVRDIEDHVIGELRERAGATA